MPAIKHLILSALALLLRTPISEIPLSYIGGGMAALMCLIALAVGIKSEKGSILSGLITGTLALAGMFIWLGVPIPSLGESPEYYVLFLWSRLPKYEALIRGGGALTALLPWLACGFAIGASSKHVGKGMMGCMIFVILLDLATYVLLDVLPIIGSVVMFIYIFFGSLVGSVLVKLASGEKK